MSELGQIVYLLNKYKFLESKLISTKFEFKNFEIACFCNENEISISHISD